MEHAPWPTIPALIEDTLVKYGDVEGYSDGETSLTFAELGDVIHAAAKGLIAFGVQPGHRVAVWAPNIVEWIEAALAIHSVGATLVTINTRFKGSEAAYILNRSKARVVFTVSDFLDIDYVSMLENRDDLDHLEHIVVLRGEPRGNAESFDDFLARGEAISDEDRAGRAAAVQPTDLCHILFTSGTTGVPKGVMLEHQAVLTVYYNLAAVFDMRHGDRQIVVLPFFHSFGLHVGILAGFMRGITIMPHLVFDPDVVMQRIQDEKITLVPGPPTIFQAMVASPRREEFDLSSMRFAMIGGAGFPPKLVTDIMDKLGVPEVRNGFGITESSGTVALVPHGATPEVIANTVGVPLPGLEVKIVGPDGDELPAGEQGEILVRGYTIMRGYLDDPEATAEAIDTDGWYHTGDVGRFREDGNLQVTDRIKDMFTVGGFNAYPAEIEAVLAKHPSVAQVAVIGVPDDRLGDVGMAFVIPAVPDPDADELIAYAREEMANYKVPRYVEFVTELPLNATGKVLKTELRAQANQAKQYTDR